MGLAHSLIEDTLLMALLGASLWGVLLVRLLLALTAGVVINRVYERLTPSEKHGGCAADGEGLIAVSTLWINAGELSGDVQAGALLTALARLDPTLKAVGHGRRQLGASRAGQSVPGWRSCPSWAWWRC